MAALPTKELWDLAFGDGGDISLSFDLASYDGAATSTGSSDSWNAWAESWFADFFSKDGPASVTTGNSGPPTDDFVPQDVSPITVGSNPPAPSSDAPAPLSATSNPAIGGAEVASAISGAGEAVDTQVSYAAALLGTPDIGNPGPTGISGANVSSSDFYVIATNGYQAFDVSTITTSTANSVRHDVVDNFRPGLTRLQLDDAVFSSIADVLAHAQQVGSDTVITVDSTYDITLKLVPLSSLSADSFLLV